MDAPNKKRSTVRKRTRKPRLKSPAEILRHVEIQELPFEGTIPREKIAEAVRKVIARERAKAGDSND